MAMKEFKITYKKYGNVCTYDKEETIKATSEKMAWKKFFDSKSYDPVRKMSRRQWMDYDRMLMVLLMVILKQLLLASKL